MRKFRSQFLLLLVLCLYTGLVQAASPKPYWDRLGGFTNQVEIVSLEQEYFYPYAEIQLKIPQIRGMANERWQSEFNAELATAITKFKQEILELASQVYADFGDETTMPYAGMVTYEVKLNQGGLLSLTLRYYTYTGGAHGMTFVEYLNFDLTTGRSLKFAEFFSTEADLNYAIQGITQQISAEPERYFINEFNKGLFGEEQDFYLQEDGVVICFGLYEIAPYASGIQEFLISLP